MSNLEYVIGMSNEEYHSHGTQYISSSFVKKTVEHSIARALEPFNPQGALKEAIEFGDAFHCFMENNDLFEKRFHVLDDRDIIKQIMNTPKPDGTFYSKPKTTKAYKSWKYSESRKFPDKELMGLHSKLRIESMADNIENNEVFKEKVSKVKGLQCVDEYSIFTKKPDVYGLKYRVRFDRAYIDKQGKPVMCFDWKTCKSASYKEFKRDFYGKMYDIQDVFYCKVSELDPENFYFIGTEKEEPHHSIVASMTRENIDWSIGRMEVALSLIADWVKRGKTGHLDSQQRVLAKI